MLKWAPLFNVQYHHSVISVLLDASKCSQWIDIKTVKNKSFATIRHSGPVLWQSVSIHKLYLTSLQCQKECLEAVELIQDLCSPRRLEQTFCRKIFWLLIKRCSPWEHLQSSGHLVTAVQESSVKSPFCAKRCTNYLTLICQFVN